MSTFTNQLIDVTAGRIDPATVLAELSVADLAEILEPSFVAAEFDELELLGQGRSRRAGDACGVLAMSREFAAELHRLGVPYIYAVEHGDTRDFTAIKHCRSFITPNPAPTAFAPVQAVSEDRTTVVGLTATIRTNSTDRRCLIVEHDQASHAVGTLLARALMFVRDDGSTTEVDEGEWICVSGTSATVRRGRLVPLLSPVARFYDLVESIIHDAVITGQVPDSAAALRSLGECHAYFRHADELAELAQHPVVRGFEEIKRQALAAPLAIWVTAHTAMGVTRTRILTGTITQQAPYLVPSLTPIGLLRDERMWHTPNELDLLQLVFLGPQVLDPPSYERVKSRYLTEHGERIYRVLAACHDAVAIVRTPCMPIVKIFPHDFDVDCFASRHSLDPALVRQALATTAGEQDLYQGWRGMRVFSQRPDIAELWLRAVLGAARRTHENGHPVHLRLLLATITLPIEAKQFLALLDSVAVDVLGGDLNDVLHGVSIMVETAGAYITLEEFLNARGQHVRIDGGMFGSNDFTAAMLNFNREDAARTIIPGYIEAGLLPHSPFEQLEPTVVGPSILSALRRARWNQGTSTAEIWGLGGELAGDWETVRWLATHAEPLGLSYVTTVPRNVLSAAFASAQAVVRAAGTSFQSEASKFSDSAVINSL